MIILETSMSIEEVKKRIQELMQESGEPPSKKKVKKSNPELMKNALFYFPSWEHALETTINTE